MPELVSLGAGVLLGYAAVSAYARNGSAVSAESQVAREKAYFVLGLAEKSHALFGEKSAAIASLYEMASECGVEGWDGDGACAISSIAVSQAVDFLRALPAGVRLPDYGTEPDGSVCFEWTLSRHRRFMISVGKGDRLAYAWVDGTDRGHAVARFDGHHIPDRILQGLKSLLTHEFTSVRAA